MLLMFFLFFTLAVSSSFALPEMRFVPAVAFSLTADYGTVALQLTSDTPISLPKIVGNSEYKIFMRREQALPLDSWFCSIWRTCARKPDIDAAQVMINALKLSAENYLGTAFCFVDIAMPDTSRNNYQREMIERAVKASGLRQSFHTQPAGRIAVLVNQPGDLDMIPDEQIALAIDCSRSGLNLDLYCDDGGILNSLRYDHNLGIGANVVDSERWNAVRSALERISTLPFPNCPSLNPTIHNKVDYIVLYGDSVNNEEFLRAIARVLGTELVAEARSWEPEFGVALRLAKSSFRGQNSVDFRGKPGFTCRWRSGLYSENTEL